MIRKEILDILACPKCKDEIIYDKKRDVIICKKCRLIYPIINDMPDMIIQDAKEY